MFVLCPLSLSCLPHLLPLTRSLFSSILISFFFLLSFSFSLYFLLLASLFPSSYLASSVLIFISVLSFPRLSHFFYLRLPLFSDYSSFLSSPIPRFLLFFLHFLSVVSPTFYSSLLLPCLFFLSVLPPVLHSYSYSVITVSPSPTLLPVSPTLSLLLFFPFSSVS